MTLFPAFALGVASGELFQWGTWKAGHTDIPWIDYWKVGLPHLLINVTVVGAVGVAWHSGLLADALGLFGATPIAQLLSVSPPYGFLLAFVSDICGDKIAWSIRALVGKWFGKKKGKKP